MIAFGLQELLIIWEKAPEIIIHEIQEMIFGAKVLVKGITPMIIINNK